ncbi:hypothetical protein Vi05172_g11327 [Venturia inaequalis]|nr:hypothetical protein Vi05172_g11327 [Venturia inaequalis]
MVASARSSKLPRLKPPTAPVCAHEVVRGGTSLLYATCPSDHLNHQLYTENGASYTLTSSPYGFNLQRTASYVQAITTFDSVAKSRDMDLFVIPDFI